MIILCFWWLFYWIKRFFCQHSKMESKAVLPIWVRETTTEDSSIFNKFMSYLCNIFARIALNFGVAFIIY